VSIRRIIDRADGQHASNRVARWSMLSRDLAELVAAVEARTLPIGDAALKVRDWCEREAMALTEPVKPSKPRTRKRRTP